METMRLTDWKPEISVVRKEDADRRSCRSFVVGVVVGMAAFVTIPFLLWTLIDR